MRKWEHMRTYENLWEHMRTYFPEKKFFRAYRQPYFKGGGKNCHAFYAIFCVFFRVFWCILESEKSSFIQKVNGLHPSHVVSYWKQWNHYRALSIAYDKQELALNFSVLTRRHYCQCPIGERRTLSVLFSVLLLIVILLPSLSFDTSMSILGSLPPLGIRRRLLASLGLTYYTD